MWERPPIPSTPVLASHETDEIGARLVEPSDAALDAVRPLIFRGNWIRSVPPTVAEAAGVGVALQVDEEKRGVEHEPDGLPQLAVLKELGQEHQRSSGDRT